MPTKAAIILPNAETAAGTLLLVGTSSGAGKSTVALGLCRVLQQKGVQVAPFKAQNLSDNAHTLPNGLRIARSQAIAAAACGVAPCTDMNPVLLVPDARGCEAVVCGRSLGRMEEGCAALQPGFLKQQALAAHSRLANQYRVVIAEGAGSPAELNLRERDFVNMGFASAVQCPVLLVADMRRGGVYAMAYGTLQLLSPPERALVKGIIVNGYCGEPAEFAQGAKQLEQVTGKPVLGILPQLTLHLEDEDCLPGAAVQTKESIANQMPPGMDYAAYQDRQLDLLADAVRRYVNLEAVLQLLAQKG